MSHVTCRLFVFSLYFPAAHRLSVVCWRCVVWRDSGICDSFVCDITHSVEFVRANGCILLLYSESTDCSELTLQRDLNQSHVTHSWLILMWHSSFTCGTWPIYMCELTHSYVTRHMHMCDATHSYVTHANMCHDSSICEVTHPYVTLHSISITSHGAYTAEWRGHALGGKISSTWKTSWCNRAAGACHQREKIFNIRHNVIDMTEILCVLTRRVKWVVTCHSDEYECVGARHAYEYVMLHINQSCRYTCMWHDLFIGVTWLIDMWHDTGPWI